MKLDNDDVTALFGTLIIHLIALLLLYFGVLRTNVPLDDGGIPVIFGDMFASVGASLPPPATTVPAQRETPPPRETPTRKETPTPPKETPTRKTTPAPAPKKEEKPITQNKTETVSVPEKTKQDDKTVANVKARKEQEEADAKARKEKAEADAKVRKEREEAAERKRQEDERRRQEEEQRKQQEAINNRVSGAFGSGNTQDSGQGETTAGTSTQQGSPFGNSTSGATQGIGGSASFNLDGRSIGAGGLPRPSYSEREEGKIVINITVDPNGNVINAEIGRGTNIDKASMRNNAIDAAKRAKFNKIQGTNNAHGTITYIYKLT